MKPTTVDIVFVLDASESMRPCFDGLASNLERVVQPLQGFGFTVRLGLVALRVGRSPAGGGVYGLDTLGENADPIQRVRDGDTSLFTDDRSKFLAAIRSLKLEGDEQQLLALDFALDFPFGPLASTRRVVALFSDEPLEGGFGASEFCAHIPDLVTKIMARRVQLFAAMPASDALDQLGAADAAQIEPVQGGDGLAGVDFGKLLAQMAKSISAASLQASTENFSKGTFGQYEWGRSDANFGGLW
jgi:hypothetical protein